MLKKLQNLTKEQEQKLNALATAEEVLDLAKQVGSELTPEETTEIASRLPDDTLEATTGGFFIHFDRR